MRIALVGPPNAGKSSLLNALAGHEAAIVSPLAGTTRDTVQVQLELAGVKVGGQNKLSVLLYFITIVKVQEMMRWRAHLFLEHMKLHRVPSPPLPQVILTDSAGLRQTECPVEAEGVRRALAAAQQAHIVVHVADVTAAAASPSVGTTDAHGSGVNATEAASGSAPVVPLAPGVMQLSVLNKADLLSPGVDAASAASSGAADSGGEASAAAASTAPLLISCKSGLGIDALLAVLRRQVQALVAGSGADDGAAAALVTRARHR